MPNIKLPSGNNALRSEWKDAKWDVSGLFVFDSNILSTIDRTKDRWNAILPIESVHGCLLYIPWNSGRLISIKKISKWNKNDIESLYKEYNDRDITIYNTFSNHLLNKSHLSNEDGNMILELLSQGNSNGIIVSSDLLSKYVKKNYPTLKQKSSIIKVSVEHPHERSTDIYLKLLDRYDTVVLHPDDNFNLDLMESLSSYGDRIEILVNEPCVVNCTIRKAHYDAVSKRGLSWQSKLSLDNDENYEWNFFNLTEAMDCGLDIADKKSITRRSCQNSDKEIKVMYDMGYRHFKLQGRDSYWYKLRYDICRYMYEQEMIFAIEVKL